MSVVLRPNGVEFTGREAEIYEDINHERRRQFQKFGQQDHAPKKWLAILVEEVGEVATHCISDVELDLAAYREELVQVAAVACSAIEALERSSGY